MRWFFSFAQTLAFMHMAVGQEKSDGDRAVGGMLVYPTDGSHWMSLRDLSLAVSRRGHRVVVALPATGNLMVGETPGLDSETFPVPFVDREKKKEMSGRFLRDVVFAEKGGSTGFHFTHLESMNKRFAAMCDSLLGNVAVMQRLRAHNFEVLLADPMDPCGAILADALGLPSIFLMRGIPCNIDLKAAHCPAPSSYVPQSMSGFTDHMSFTERVTNMFMGLKQDHLCIDFLLKRFDELARRHLGRDVTAMELLSNASIWLHRTDFVFDYPRPTMPNMVNVGGMTSDEAKPLPQDLEEFMQSSEEHGVVVVSFGSMVSAIPYRIANVLAEGLGRIPQKVIWRYEGPTLENLSNNTKVMSWLPQRDLLAHAKTRVFVTHGGSHGIFEAICYGVPMLGLPLFGDQFENLARMQSKGAALVLNIHSLDAGSLASSISTIATHKSSYKEKASLLSRLHHDHPQKPMDRAVFWVEFVMRHGAEHLRVAAHHLTWYQEAGFDVAAFLLAAIVLVTSVFIALITICCRWLCRAKHRNATVSKEMAASKKHK
ncbi:UDP-glucuronosyltransferase 1A5-like [Petromyzon marinus]|uniref:UDP-glucuronosyltransferase 1A5-like n=1 Tax=Petromyzon marinus TaxID=7757 RepID=UPI003F709EF6